MKVLQIIPYLPTPPTSGGALRMYHILKYLTRHHDVTVAGFYDKGDVENFKAEFPGLSGKMHFIERNHFRYRRLIQLYSLLTDHSYWYNWAQSKELENVVRSLVNKEDFDIILGEFASMGHFDLDTDAIRIMDAHNIEYDNFRRMSTLDWSFIRKKFYEREYEKCLKEEVEAFKRHDAIFATSQRDADIIGNHVDDIPRFVIPNGVDSSYFTPGETESEPFSMVFTGAMKYVPNYDGVIKFLDEIFPLIKKQVPGAKMYVVGSNPPSQLKAYESESVTVTGFVDDVRPYIDKASVFVVPLYMGSGTRLKVVEALSMQIPVVSTSIGCEGIDVSDGEHLIIRDNSAEFADAVVDLFENHDLRRKLISNGDKIVQEKYDWRIIGQSIEEAFYKLTQPGIEGKQHEAMADINRGLR